jgi:uncharacterized protein YhdP
MLKLPRLSALPALLIRWIAWALLGLSLVVGIIWALMHFWIVPRISDLRPHFESMASSTLGMPVSMGQLHVESNGWAPAFKVDQLSLHKPDGGIALTLPTVRVVVSANSLLTLGIEQLMLEGADLDVRRTQEGQILVAGLVAVWSLRLGLYIAFRVARTRHHHRDRAQRAGYLISSQSCRAIRRQPRASACPSVS